MVRETFDPENLPESIEVEIFLSLGVGKYNYGELSARDYEKKSSSGENWEEVNLGSQIVTLTIPKFGKGEIRDQLLEQLNDEKQKKMAEHEMAMRNIQERINNLLLIEYQELQGEEE